MFLYGLGSNIFTYSLNSSRNVSLNFLQIIFITIRLVFASFQRFDNYLVQILNFDELIMSLTMCVNYRAPHESSRCSDTYEGEHIHIRARVFIHGDICTLDRFTNKLISFSENEFVKILFPDKGII